MTPPKPIEAVVVVVVVVAVDGLIEEPPRPANIPPLVVAGVEDPKLKEGAVDVVKLLPMTPKPEAAGVVVGKRLKPVDAVEAGALNMVVCCLVAGNPNPNVLEESG